MNDEFERLWPILTHSPQIVTTTALTSMLSSSAKDSSCCLNIMVLIHFYSSRLQSIAT
jgi:hypothetical protein